MALFPLWAIPRRANLARWPCRRERCPLHQAAVLAAYAEWTAADLWLPVSFSETCQSRDLSFVFSSFLLLCSSCGLQLLKVSGREGNLIAIFHEEHSRVLQQLQVFTFFPETLPAAKKPFERKSIDRQSARKPLLGLVSREVGKGWVA